MPPSMTRCTSIKYHFAIGSCLKIIHLPWLILSLIKNIDLCSNFLLWTIVHNTSQLLILFLNQSFSTELKLIYAFLLLITWITILVKFRVIATYALWKVPGNAINTTSVIALLAIVSVVHGVILSPFVIFIICVRFLVVELTWFKINLCIGTTYHIWQHNGQCEQNEPVLRNHYSILKIINIINF